MLFDVSHDDMVSVLGTDAVFVAPPAALRAVPEGSDAHRLLGTVGIPTGVFRPQTPRENGGFPLVRDRIDLSGHETPQGCEDCENWVVFGWIPLTALALDTGTGGVHGFSENGGPVHKLHQDLSSLVQLTFQLQRLLKQFTPTDDEDADYERRAKAVSGIREHVEERDALPFSDDSIWPQIMEEIAAGMWS
ncbi:SUKH-4 family immunity protein [Streptomyces echinoruber]|uniref:SUKH-4 family immunity protein n=2 Tax=Streptomyces echinoruber TaxID=68898 RepID=UPI003618CA87